MKPGTPPSKLQNELKQPGMGGEPAPPTTKEAAADQLRRILETTTLGQLWAHRAAERGPIVKEPVHQVTTQDSVDTVMELMAKQRLSAVPVFNATKKKYVGFVDRLDLATFVLDRLSGNDNPQPAEIDYIAKSCSAERVENVVGTPRGIWAGCWGGGIPRWYALIGKVSGTDDSTGGTDFSHWDPLVMVKEDVPISAVLKHLADGVHRVALYDEDESVMTGVISQRMVVRWLLPLVDKFEPLFSQTLQQLGQLGMGDVLTVRSHRYTSSSTSLLLTALVIVLAWSVVFTRLEW